MFIQISPHNKKCAATRQGMRLSDFRAVHGRSKRPPDAHVPRGLFHHSFRMELQADNELRLGIIEGFDQTVVRISHWPESAREAANTLMMIAVHLDFLRTIPF